MPCCCPNCGMENPDDAWWCNHCNAKLDTLPKFKKNRGSPPIHRSPIKQQRLSHDFNQPGDNNEQLLILLAVPFILGGLLVISVVITDITDFSGINCKINEDFWFEGNFLNTSDGWSFYMTKVTDYILDGRVLGLRTYSSGFSSEPVDVFSPVDFYIGVDDVKDNPDKYVYSISYRYRVAFVKSNAEPSYFFAHSGNNHIIPHNQEVLDELRNISVKDCVYIEGSLVNLRGTRNGQTIFWETGDRIGDNQCEIILVDHVAVNST